VLLAGSTSPPPAIGYFTQLFTQAFDPTSCWAVSCLAAMALAPQRDRAAREVHSSARLATD